jgi:hypothetical protein
MIVFNAVHTSRVVESLGQKSFDCSWASHQAQLHQNAKLSCAYPETLNIFSLPPWLLEGEAAASGGERPMNGPMICDREFSGEIPLLIFFA